MNDRQSLENQLRMYSFALLDAGLYLDSHTTDAAAMKYFEETRQLYDEAVKTFESKYGPLTVNSSVDTTRWSWVDDPWPWEGGNN